MGWNVKRKRAASFGVLAFLAALAVCRPQAVLAFQTSRTGTLLEGRWRTVSIERNGKLITDPGAIKGMRLVFEGNMVIIAGLYGPQEERCSFAVVNTTSPKQLDWTRPNGTKVQLLYELRDDALRIAFPFAGSNERPRVISGAAESRTIVMTLKRE